MRSVPAEKPQQDIIFIMGGPGSGKGTQSAILQKSKGYCHISPGAIIRKILNEPPEVVSESKSIKKEGSEKIDLFALQHAVKNGVLLDDHLIIKLIKKEMELFQDAPGFIIDGCPRTLEQLTLFESLIGPCTKILYLDLPEKIMLQRIHSRSHLEGRLDDHDIAFRNRIKTYREQTLPLIKHLEKTRNRVFYKIDATQSIEEVERVIRRAVAHDRIVKVHFLDFVKLYLNRGNYYNAVDALERRYNATNFEVVLSCVTMFYVIQNKNYVEKVLTARTDLGHHYNNFTLSNGHRLNIVGLEAFGERKEGQSSLWRDIHSALAQSIGNRELIFSLIQKHIKNFLAKPIFHLDIEFENFMLDFWCDYLFGDKVSSAEYRRTREKLIAATHYAYYDSKLKSIPYVGHAACRFYGYLKGKEFKQIDRELQTYIHASKSGLIHRFRTCLEKTRSFPKEKLAQAVLDNTFDFVLVFDFIFNAMYESLALVVKNELNTFAERKSIYAHGLRNAFLFPYRSRCTKENIQLGEKTVKKGSTIYINLLESGFPHSHGPRSCIGVGVSNWIQESIWLCLQDKTFSVVNITHPDTRRKLALNRDIPVSPERYEVRWAFPRDYLQKVLPQYFFKGVAHFYDVLKTYENPELTAFITNAFIERIEKLKLPLEDVCIVSPEVRGIPIAAMVANSLHVPFIMIRKPGKIPGLTLSESYSTAYSEDKVEVAGDSHITKHAILIDDGIASGGTILACWRLIKKMDGEVKAILAIINHTYAPRPRELSSLPIFTLFDFEESKKEFKPSLFPLDDEALQYDKRVMRL